MSTAMVGEAGMPRVNSGMSAPLAWALFAVSGPATPSTAPWPSSARWRENRFSAP
jgi:hypothetical protein